MADPQRIVSLVPSLSSTVVALGLQDVLVGCTQFCVEPPNLHRTAKIIGGTKDPDLDEIADLNPTHIVVNGEENKPEHILACQAIAPTLVTYPKKLIDTSALIEDLGQFLECRESAVSMKSKFDFAYREMLAVVNLAEPKKFLYFIWRKPWMLAGHDTYISNCLELIGWVNMAPTGSHYPEIDFTDFKSNGIDCCLFSSEPYPFRQRDLTAFVEEWQPVNKSHDMKLAKVDGQLFSWYGVDAIECCQQMKYWLQGKENKLVKEMDL